MSADTAAIALFRERFLKLIEDEGYVLYQVFNGDETGGNWRQLPTRTLVTDREKEANGFKKSKDRITLLACANASGTICLPLMFIHKSADPRCFKHLNKDKLHVHY